MRTANRKPPFGVPTIFMGTVVPTNLSEQPIGNQWGVGVDTLGSESISTCLPLRLASRGAELDIVVCSDKFVGTALVPTKLVGTAVPTNLSEQTTWCSNRK